LVHQRFDKPEIAKSRRPSSMGNGKAQGRRQARVGLRLAHEFALQRVALGSVGGKQLIQRLAETYQMLSQNTPGVNLTGLDFTAYKERKDTR
jgi:hypothetical protein